MAREKQHRDRPVYFVVRSMVDPLTGAYTGCLVPDGWMNQKVLRERKYRTGDLLRATINHPRNSKFHRLVHQLGTLVRENLPEFEHLNSHAVIKKLQRDSGVCCEPSRIDAAPVVEAILAAAEAVLGEAAARMLAVALPAIKDIDLMTPQSISYDCMDESDFRILWDGMCAHLVERYWPQLSVQQITDMAELMPQSEGA